jgi:hypothetical protein
VGSCRPHLIAFIRLNDQLGSQAKRPVGLPFSRYYYNALEVEASVLPWEAGFPVETDVAASAPFVVKDIQAGLNAMLVHEWSPDSPQQIWPEFVQRVPSNGYRIPHTAPRLPYPNPYRLILS